MATTFDIPNAGNPQDVTTVADISTITSATPKGSLTPKPVLPADTAPVNQMMSYTDIINQSQQDLANTQASRNQEMIDQSIKRYLGLDGGVGVAERKQEEINAINEKFDVSGTSARLAKIKADIEANKLSAEGQKQGIGQNTGGLTEADIAGFGEQIDRRIASKNLALSAEGLALQGNLAAAESAIKSSVDAKYAPIEAKYKAILEYNTLNEKTLGREAEKQQQRANAKLKELEEKKKEEEEVGVMIAEAVPNAPADVISRAKKLAESGASKLEVAQSLGKYGGDYLKMEAYRSQLETDKAQRANIYSQIAERNAEAIKKNNLANFVAPPIVNAQTGAVDPKSAIASVIKSTGGKLKGGQAALDVLSSVQSLAARNTKGTFEGVGFGSGLTPERFKSQSEISNRQDIEAIGLKVQQWASGASLTEEQTKMVNKFTPQLGDSDNAVKSKINGLVNFMMGQVSSDLAGQGISYDPGVIDMFSGIQSLDNKSFLGSIPSAPTDTTKLFDNKTFFNR